MAPQVDWWFRPEPPDRSRDFGNANIWSFKPGLHSFVREVGQNTIDVRVASSVDLTFRIIRLAGEELEDFLAALEWHSTLRQHLEASVRSGQKLGRSLNAGLEKLDESGELVLLRIEEQGAYGLEGEEFGSGNNFVGLCRNNLDSAKVSATAGGAFGLGKAVLWRTSMLSTVLFNSDIDHPDFADKDNRLIGRSELSWHEVDGAAFAGPGWFGQVEGDEPAVSRWSDGALVRRLCLERPDSTGTSILVVGFHDPTDDSDSSDDDLAEGLRVAVAASFWPALESGTLTAAVEIAHGRDAPALVDRRVVDPARIQPAFVSALRAYREETISDELAQAEDVVRIPVPLKVPAQRDGTHGEVVHDTQVLVRRASIDEPDVGKIVFYRGTEMVIETRDFRSIRVGACPFHAVVLCGLAAGDAPEATVAEEFLRAAEPPAHNSWELTEDVRVTYARGGGANLERFFEAVRSAVRDVVGPPTKDLSDGPRGLKELFRIATPVDPKVKRPEVVHAEGAVRDDGSWLVTARVQVHDTSSAWSGRPTVVFGAETGGGSRVRWSTLEAVNNCRVDGGAVQIDRGVKQATFKGSTDPASHPVPAGLSAISVELRDAHQTNA